MPAALHTQSKRMKNTGSIIGNSNESYDDIR